MIKKRLLVILALLILLAIAAIFRLDLFQLFADPQGNELDEHGYYTTPEDVALYIHIYQRLPGNYITKSEARELGWDSAAGNLWEVTDSLSIGGDRFYNREGLLPDAPGRVWYECDVNYNGGHRGPERLIYSNDGLIYYTDDHYQTFTRLY